MSFIPQIDPVFVVLAGCALLTWTLMRRARRLRFRQGGGHLEQLPRPTGQWDGAQRDVAAMIERQQVELQELARDVAGQIDSKLILLEQLIDQSQRQIDRLEKLLADARGTQVAADAS